MRGVLLLSPFYKWETESQRGSVTVAKITQQAAQPIFKSASPGPELQYFHTDNRAASAARSHWTESMISSCHSPESPRA